MAFAQDTGKPLPLRLTDKGIHDATLTLGEDGTYEIRTTGADPYLFTEPFATPLDADRQHVLAFEYFSLTGTDSTQVFLNPPLRELDSVKGEGLLHSEGWTRYALDLQPALKNAKSVPLSLRLDFGSKAGKVIRLRALQLRPMTAAEQEREAKKEALRAAELRKDARLRAYLKRTYPCQLTRVALDDKQVTVAGSAGRISGPLLLVEVPLSTEVVEGETFSFTQPLKVASGGRFTVIVPRQGKGGDRLLSRWAVARKKPGNTGYELLSHLRYTDTVQPRAKLPEEKPRNKQGIGGLSLGRPLSDLDDLHLSAATVNIVLSSLLSATPGEGWTPYQYQGKTWYSNNGQVEQLDKTLTEAAKRHIVVSAIILVGQAGNAPAGSFSRLIAHPDADPSGIFAMPNLTSEEGVRAYGAALDFLANRYGRADNKYGRIHHWIMHNEINAGWVWTNAGEKTALRYMDLYHKSMRMAQLIARQYDPHAKAFISLEHHWTMVLPKFYAGRELLELLTDFSRAEGDFDWAIAFHPYPQNLFDPRVWADNEVTFTFDTPKITFKNLEVLDAWVKLPHMRYQGKMLRTVHLTEQGLNSLDYSEENLRNQAAGMAYAWNKYKHLNTIEVFHYHNWVDNRGEGGLRIGLRKFPDDKDDPLGKKPIWYVFQALGTDKEAEVLAPYKSVVGVQDWAEVRHRGPIH
jgi:hypothetical protein